MTSRRRIYLASPLGFSVENKDYLERIKKRLRALRLLVWDPWEQDWTIGFEAVKSEKNADRKDLAAVGLAGHIGEANARAIRESAMVFGVCDGPQVDDGTASEMGYGAGRGLKVYGLRTDFRNVGDLSNLPVNLQVFHFVHGSGGKLFRSIPEIAITP